MPRRAQTQTSLLGILDLNTRKLQLSVRIRAQAVYLNIKNDSYILARGESAEALWFRFNIA
jgi:hypothetical protein